MIICTPRVFGYTGLICVHDALRELDNTGSTDYKVRLKRFKALSSYRIINL